MHALLTRRSLLQFAGAALVGRESPLYAYVGSLTSSRRNAHGNGINVYRIAPPAGTWTHVQHVGNLVNPGFLITSRDHRFLYSSHQTEKYISAFAIDQQTGLLTLLNQASTEGSSGVHQAIDPTGRFLLVAGYSTGSVAVLPLQTDGRVERAIEVFSLKGQPGPDRIEQTSSHPHQIVFDPTGRFVVVPDKGFDRTFVFRLESGKLAPHGWVGARAGAGPRHIVFHPTRPSAWLLNELDSTVSTHEWKDGELKPVQILSTLPDDFTGASTAGEIVISKDGRFVYCSNRGHDSVAVFSVDATRGRLTTVSWTPSAGKTPRFITLDPLESMLYAANEEGDSIACFRRDRRTGKLRPTGQAIRTDTPVTIAFIPAS